MILILAGLLFGGGFTTGWPLMEHIAYALVALDLLAFVLVRLGAHGLVVSASTDRVRLTAGESVEEVYRFEKRSRWPAAWIEVQYPDTVANDALDLIGGRERLLRRSRLLPRRGRYNLGGARIRIRDPFGLLAWAHLDLPPIPVTVYPRPIQSREVSQAVQSLFASRHRWQSETADGTIGDLRGYRPGDPPSRIHWRTSARRDTLIVAEPERQRRRACWLLVDLGGGPATGERSAGIAAALADHLVRTGSAVGAIVAGNGHDATPARRGREGLAMVLDTLALVPEAGRSQLDQLAYLAGECEDAGSLIVVTAAPVPTDVMRTFRALSSRVLIVPVGSAA